MWPQYTCLFEYGYGDGYGNLWLGAQYNGNFLFVWVKRSEDCWMAMASELDSPT